MGNKTTAKKTWSFLRAAALFSALLFFLISAGPAGATKKTPGPASKPAPKKTAKTVAASGLSKETQLKLLKLKEARVSLQSANDLYDEKLKDLSVQKELYSKDVVTGKEVSDAEIAVKNEERKKELARIDLYKTALSFLQEATHISIVEAYQYMDQDNNRHMSMTLINDSNLDMAKIGISDDSVNKNSRQEYEPISKGDVPGLLTIENLYVSIKNGATVIGDPFEIKIDKLSIGKTAHLDFKLNSNANDVSVSLKYHGQEEMHNIFLSKKSTEDIVRVSAQQFAQEGQLGAWVDFGIDLERLAENEKTFTLAVVNLPEKFQYKFTDEGNQISRVKFSQGVTTHSIILKVNVPDTLDSDELKKPIRFYVAVGEDTAIDAIKKFEVDSKGGITDAELSNVKTGFDKIELTPRGTPKFDLTFTTLYYEIKVGEKIETKMNVKNTGSVKLTNIRFKTEAPSDWTVTFKPQEVSELAQRKDVDVVVTLSPPDDPEIGEYEVKIEGSTEYEGTTNKSSQKDMRIKISSQTNLGGNLFIILLLIGGVVILAVVTVKLSRR